MSDRIYTATAGDLMTPNPEGKSTDASAADVLEWMQNEDYHAAPLFDGRDRPTGYVRRSHIEDRSRQINVYQKNFQLDVILSTGAPFEALLDALCKNYFYFLGGADELAGILTRADLNKPPVYIHLYERLTDFEELLREYIKNELEDWTRYLDAADLGRIKSRKEGLDLINYAGFSDVVYIVSESEIWRQLGYESAEKAESELGKVKDLRNDVAHRKLILYQDEIKNESEGRNIVDLRKTYAELQRVTKRFGLSESTSGVFENPVGNEILKQMYQNCQVCDDGPMTEVCHIIPRSEEGRDTIENKLILCPNHHMEFDYGQLRIDPDSFTIQEANDRSLVGTKLTIRDGHNPSSEYLRQRQQ